GVVVACSADGRQFAIADDKAISLGDANGRAGPAIQPGGAALLAFDPRNEHLASLRWWHGPLHVLKVASGEAAWTCPEQAKTQRVFAFSSDGRQIASAGDDRIVRIWTTEGELVAELPAQDDAILSLAFSPDDRLLAVGLGEQQKQVRLWRLQPPRPGPVLVGH